MARLLLRSVKTLTLTHPPSSRRSYLAFNDNLLRILSTEITYFSDYHHPLTPPPTFRSFDIEDRPGEPWVRLRRDGVRIDATMFDGVAPVPEEKRRVYEGETRLHVSFVVEVTKGDEVLEFVCSAWPESMQVERVFPMRRSAGITRPYMGRKFKYLPEDLQKVMLDYLEEGGVDDELAMFLHQYMANKDKSEILRWMKKIESFVKK
ncbi:uncharacterized protein M6B38_358875 [Iris pallida]|uniref:Mitochondrial glycoprotein n=1 Tax=Iris pallida TaxID=29817 RepID=A0AAX6GKT4_IRIPA|nr:uncharacterized protein M6B38_358875 [Iris pallida]